MDNSDDFKEFTKNKVDRIEKAMDRIKCLLDEEQYAKIEDDFEKVIGYLEDIDYEL